MGKGFGKGDFDFLYDVRFNKNEIDVQEIKGWEKLLSGLPINQTPLMRSNFVLDYTRQKYILMDGPVEKISSYQPEDFLDGGFDFMVSIFKKGDLPTFTGGAMAAIFKFLKTIPPEEHNEYVFSLNYKVVDKVGKMVNILQRFSIFTSSVTGLPLVSYGNCTDITYFKTDNVIVLVIERLRKGDIQPTLIDKQQFYPDPAANVFTRREKEILLWLCEGLSTKQIAAKLNISENTMNNHRKNMMTKCNVKNVAELIKYAIRTNSI